MFNDTIFNISTQKEIETVFVNVYRAGYGILWPNKEGANKAVCNGVLYRINVYPKETK